MTTQQRTGKCRRIVPQPSSWTDLPRIIPFAQSFASVNPQTTRVSNAAKVPFHCCGLAVPAGVPAGLNWRIKWPDGTYLSRDPFVTQSAAGPIFGPVGAAGNMGAIPSPVVIAPGARIAVETSGATGDFSLQFWGWCRYPDTTPRIQDARASERAKGVETTCLIGYPVGDGCLIGYPTGRVNGAPDPAATAAAILSNRFQCNGNLLAPEFRLGNQCDTFTPDGSTDECFTFLTDPITLEPNQVISGINVVIPGLSDSKMVFRRWRAITTWVPAGTGEIIPPPDGGPAVALRTPDGYSVTGGDMIPMLPWAWMPFPVFEEMRAGGRLVLDVSTFLATAVTLSMTFQIEFDCAKRVKV